MARNRWQPFPALWKRHWKAMAGASLLTCAVAAPAAASTPSVEQALRLKPVQADVDYDTPTADEIANCTLKAEKIGSGTGWVVRDSTGRLLRRFVDSNNDNVVDLWCYYQNGVEIYRDIDGDFNGKADQYRWYNIAGTRHGIDKNEDGRIDAWKTISAEEVTSEVVKALADRDADRFARLLITPEEIDALGMSADKAKELREKVSEAKAQFEELARGQKDITPKTVWLHFGALRPGVVPAGTDGSTNDVVVYENVATLVETEGKTGHVKVGTLVQAGNAWRLIGLPQVDGEAGDQGHFFHTASVTPEAPANVAGAMDEKFQKLLSELETLDKQLAAATRPADKVQLNERRADLLESLAEEAGEAANKAQWLQQLADTLSAAAQSGDFPGGVDRLKKLQTKLKADKAGENLLAYVEFRLLTADYTRSLQDPKADFPKIQEAWLKSLEQFVKDHPGSTDAAEAMLQLAIAEEFSGKEDEAKKWYGQIVSKFPSTPAAKKASGAVRRLNSVGQNIELAGTAINGGRADLAQYRGKVVLVHYWATWCEPCVRDLTTIKEVYSKYGRAGFVPLGISLDYDKSQVTSFLQSNKLPWVQIYEPGSLDGRLANELGILTLPTMLLIDEKGRVVNRNLHISELEAEVKKYTAGSKKR